MTTILTVDGMSCEHCVKAVKGAAGALPGVSSVTVDLAAKTVAVEHDASVGVDAIKTEIEEQGYDVVE